MDGRVVVKYVSGLSGAVPLSTTHITPADEVFNLVRDPWPPYRHVGSESAALDALVSVVQLLQGTLASQRAPQLFHCRGAALLRL